MTHEQLISTFPRLYHSTTPDALPAIEQHGLLSTSAILDRCNIVGDDRHALERDRRPASVHVSDGTHRYRIADNAPLSLSKLAGCLDDMTTQQWMAHLNARVFFWVEPGPLKSLLNARLNRGLEKVVLVVNTARLVAAHADDIRLAPYNTGSTLHTPPRRGTGTFQTIADYDFEHWRQKRSRRTAVRELTVLGGVPRVMSMVVEVQRYRDGERI